MVSKKLLRNAKNETAIELFMISGMSYRKFTDFWNMDHSTLVKLVNRKKHLEAEGDSK